MALSPYLNRPVRSREDAANDVRTVRASIEKRQKAAKKKSKAEARKSLFDIKRLVG